MSDLMRTQYNAQLLESIPVLATLDDSQRQELAAGMVMVRVAAGELLFSKGDAADAMYVVVTGRLEVSGEEEGDSERARTVGHGGVLGEMSLLTGDVRSASVRARTDARLMRLDRSDFDKLMQGPKFAQQIARQLAKRLEAAQETNEPSPPKRTRIAILGFDEAAPVELMARRLTELFPDSKIAVIEADGREQEIQSLEEIDRAGETAGLVLMIAPYSARRTAWWDLLLVQADRVIGVVTNTEVSAELSGDRRLTGCDLATIGSRELKQNAKLLEPAIVHPLAAADDPVGLQKLGRRLLGRSVGVALSGGGARAYAHIGALAELKAIGVEIDRVGAVSLGSLIGAVFAMGNEWDEVAEIFRATDIPSLLAKHGLAAAGVAREMILGSTRIESLPMDFFAICVDLIAGAEVIYREGPLVDVIAASMALPGLSEPVVMDGRILVDGALINPLPALNLIREGDGPVIAIDISGRTDRLGILGSRWSEPGAALPSPAEVAQQSLDLASIGPHRRAQQAADLLITPEIRAGASAYHRLDDIVEFGRASTREFLGQLSEEELSRFRF